MPPRATTHGHRSQDVFGERAAFGVLLGLLVLAFALGGSSQRSVPSAIVLLPLGVLAATYFIYVRSRVSGPLGVPAWLCVGLFALLAAQLVPLPPAIWHDLPGRGLTVAVEQAIGLPSPWRPLSMTPAYGWQDLFGLFVPFAILLAIPLLDRRRRDALLMVLLGYGLVNAAVGALQVLGPDHSPLYLYAITNNGYPVGLLANRNHASVLTACTIALCGYRIGRLGAASRAPALQALLFAGAVLLLLPIVFISGSRAGLLITVPALILAGLFAAQSPYVASLGTRRGRKSGRTALLAGFAALVVLVVAAVFLQAQDAAYNRLVEQDVASDLRFAVLPTVWSMTREFFPWGAGFGSFADVYRIHERAGLLGYEYLNQAHDDWLQLVLEGGLVAAGLLAGFIVWLGARAWAVFRAGDWRGSQAVPCLALICFMGAASFFDYPLRVQALMAYFAVLCGLLEASSGTGRRHASFKPDRTNEAPARAPPCD